MNTRRFTRFYDTNLSSSLMRIVLTFIVFSPFIAPAFVFPKHKYHWVVTTLCRTVIPVSLGNFALFGLAKFVSFKAGLINEQTADSRTKTE